MLYNYMTVYGAKKYEYGIGLLKNPLINLQMHPCTVSALLLWSTSIAALPLGPYALPTQSKVSEQPDIPDDSTVTDWPLHLSEEPLQAEHYIPDSFSTDLWTRKQNVYRTSTASNSVLLPVVDVPDVTGKEMEDSLLTAITEPNISTYLFSGTEQVLQSDSATPLVFPMSTSSNNYPPSQSSVLVFPAVTEERVFPPVSSADSSQFVGKQSIMSDDDQENVPVMKSALLSETGDANQNSSGTEGTTVSINGVSKYAIAYDNSSVPITSKDLRNISQSVFNSSESFLSDNFNISVDPITDNLNSFSHSINKALVNTPRIVTRDVRNSSELSINTSSPVSVVTSHGFDRDVPDHTSLASSPLTHLKPLTLRAGKSVGYSPPQQHPLVLSTVSPSKGGPDAFPFPHSSDTSDVMQGNKQGPKSSGDFLSSSYVKAIVTDSEVPEDSRSDSRVFWISKTTPVSAITPEHKKKISKVESKPNIFGVSQAEDVEMADSPYNPPESSTITGSKPGAAGDGVSKPPSTSSHEFVVPANRTVDGNDTNPSDSHHFSSGRNVTVQDKETDKVTPQLMNSSKVMNTSSHSVLQSDNRTKISQTAPKDSENVNGNTSVASSTDVASTSVTTGEAGSFSADGRSSVLVLPTSASGLKQVGNVTTAKVVEENQTNIVTVLPTTVPVSNGRVAAGDESHHDLDAASITGIALGILVCAGLIGKID